MINVFRKFCMVIVIALLPLQVIRADAPPTAGLIPPSDVLYLSLKSMAENPSMNRMEQVGKFYGRLQTENLDDDEKFALGEVHFLNFKPKEALEIFEQFMGGSDLRARVAWQRAMQIRFRSFKEHDKVEEMIGQYRAKFEPSNMDVWHSNNQTANLSRKYQEEGNHQKVVDLITAEIDSLPGDAPYISYRLPAQFYQSFKETGNETLVQKMIADIQLKLGKLSMGEMMKSGPHEYVAGTLYRMEEGLSGAFSRANYPSANLRLQQYNMIMKQLVEVAE